MPRSRSRSPTPIHGYDDLHQAARETSQARRERELVEAEAHLSPIKRVTGNQLVRKKRVFRPYQGPTTRTRRASSSVSTDDGRGLTARSSSTQSLDWFSDSESPSFLTTSTQFDVTVADSENDTTIEDDIQQNPDDSFTTPNTSINTVRMAGGAEEQREDGVGLVEEHGRGLVDGAAGPGVGEGEGPEQPETPIRLFETLDGIPLGAQRYIKILKRAESIWFDDFHDLDPSQHSKGRLATKVQRAELQKERVMDAILELEDLDDAFWDDAKDEAANKLKASFALFLREADKVLHRLEAIEGEAGVQQNPATAVKKKRVQKNQLALIAEMTEMTGSLNLLAKCKPDTEPAFILHQEQVNETREKAKLVISDAKDMVVDATDAGLGVEAEALDTAARLLKAADKGIATELLDKKGSFGILSHSTRTHKTDVPVPKFSGNPADPDFFTFTEEWNQYVGSKVMSEAEKFRVLTRTSLIGQAQVVSRRFKTVDEVFTHLKKTYGNPRYLFSAKLDELRKLGNCVGTDVKKREWVVEVRSRLDDVHKLAVPHNLLDKLYHSSIIGEIEKGMVYYMAKEYKKRIRKKDKTGNLDEKGHWDVMCTYLDDLVDELTFEVNHALNTGAKASEHQPRDKKAAPVTKKAYSSVQVEDEEDSSINVSSKQVVKQTKVKKPVSSRGKKVNNINNINNINANVNVPAGYIEPPLVNCVTCSTPHTHMFCCVQFQKARGVDRVNIASKQRVCFRCLRMDSQADLKNREVWWSSHEMNCVTTWVCTFEKCPKVTKMRQFHILMCGFHTEQNKEHERAFIADMDQSLVRPGLRFFFNQNMFQLDAQVLVSGCTPENVLDDITSPSIFMLQHVEHDGQVMLLFYDSGCGGAALSNKASEILSSICVREGPTLLNVAGGATVRIEGGDEQFHLPLDGSKMSATLTGLKMPTVTTRFPTWDISKAWENIEKDLNSNFPEHAPLPPVAASVGGECVDLMVGIRYIKYFPNLLYMLPCGLGIYKSQFGAPRGETCILGGPHPSWEHCREASNFLGPYNFLSAEMKAYYFACSTIQHVYSPAANALEVEDEATSEDGDVGGADPGGQIELWDADPEHLLHDGLDPWELEGAIDPITAEDWTEDYIVSCAFSHCGHHARDDGSWVIPSNWDTSNTIYSMREGTSRFMQGELSGSEITYRCVMCRNCSACRNSETLEATSLREEQEQHLIESCVTFIPEEKRLVSKLPFIANPKDNLFPNRYAAEKVFQSQMNKISKSEDMKNDVLASFNKLASRGYLLPVSALSEDDRKLVLSDSDAGYFIPWRVVFKENSLSTPCRIVFDASARTPGGASLNEILAKGANRLANLHHILLRFRNRASAFCADIRMAYNQVGLVPEHYRYQRFLWKQDLNPTNPTIEHIIATLIYGIKPVGNSLQCGVTEVAVHVEVKYPEHRAGAEALKKDAYVDDVGRADHTKKISRSTAASLDFTLAQASMEVKGYTFSGEDPPPEVSADGKRVGLLGMAWSPKEDVLQLDIKPLYFGKPKRGKLPELVTGDFGPALRKHFSRRNMLGKVMGVFDPLGLATPVTARLKLDLHNLVDLKLDWDTRIPDEYLDTWMRNITDIQEIREVKFRRTIIPEDAVSPDVELIVSADASQFIAVAAVHGRVRRRSGGYSCQLMSAKSKLVKELTIPKAELRAAVLATHLAHTVKFNLGDQLKHSLYLTDSSICLFWINQDERPLEVTVRNCVIDIRRFTSPSQWYHIETDNNIADLGTRDSTISEIAWDSDWQQGKDWMRLEREDMPVRTLEQVKVSSDDKKTAASELRTDNSSGIMLPLLATKVSDRYCFAKYIVDPNHCKSWPWAVRVASCMLKFIRKIRPTWQPSWIPNSKPTDQTVTYVYRGKNVLNEFDIRVGEKYFFHLTTLEVEKFVPAKDLKDTDKQDGVLYYTGRILDGQEVLSPVDTMFDLDPLHFVKPVVDRYSPVAYCIMVYAHGTLGRHRNSAATLRISRTIAYILRGRELAIEVREACRYCTRYRAKLVKVEMGKIHDTRLTIAPAFYISQVDLMGPMLAYCEHNHRSSVKVWACVFKDPSSSAISVHAMGSYSTDEFLMCYTRFSSRYGHPAKLCIDEGSQLLAACRRMELSIVDITNSLSTKFNVGIDYTSCPVGGHNVHGIVERSIQNVNDLFKKVYKGIKLDVLAYETCFAWISSQLNNIPLCLGSKTDNLDNLDLITPSRLLLGRASSRAIGGHARIAPPSRLVKQMDSVYQSWWKVWQEEQLANYVPQPSKWKQNNVDISPGDIVLMLMNGDDVQLGGPIWRIARVRSVETNHQDGLKRTAICEYRIPGETGLRSTRRSVRKLAIIHQEDSLDLIQQLNEAAKESGVAYHAARLREPP